MTSMRNVIIVLPDCHKRGFRHAVYLNDNHLLSVLLWWHQVHQATSTCRSDDWQDRQHEFDCVARPRRRRQSKRVLVSHMLLDVYPRQQHRNSNQLRRGWHIMSDNATINSVEKLLARASLVNYINSVFSEIPKIHFSKTMSFLGFELVAFGLQCSWFIQTHLRV